MVPFTGEVVKPTPVHTIAVMAVIAGVGFTVTVTVNAFPVQLPDNGVTV